MEKFKMIEGNPCSKCGKPIAAGDAVYAASFDAVRSGVGICERCAAPAKPVAKEPKAVETEWVETQKVEGEIYGAYHLEDKEPAAKKPAPEPAKKATGRKK